MSEGEVIRTADLGRRFGRHWALSHVSLSIGAGAVWLVAGANGSGKTTLLRVLSGLTRASSGSVSILGRDPRRERSAYRDAIGLLTHHEFLYGGLTAREMLTTWSRLLGRREDTSVVPALLEEVGLGAAADTQVSGFSAGMRKRLSFARLRLEEPRVALLDEPFSALDERGRTWVAGWIRQLRDQGATVVLASHSLERAAAVADHAVALEKGQVMAQGDPAAVIRRVESAR